MKSTTIVISVNASRLRVTGGEAESPSATVAGHSAAYPERTWPAVSGVLLSA